ncbi:MAG: GNAT family N-acetyltransferase [Streptomycetales bacterium]
MAAAEPKDVEAIATLLEEMDRFYGADEVKPLELRVRQIAEAIIDDRSPIHALLAWDGGQLIGIATYSFLWPAMGVTRSLYLKELYVARDHQRKGVGKLLMDCVVEAAAKNRCSRVEWTTDEENPGAQEFYEKLGFSKLPSKVFYRHTISSTRE